MVDPQATLSIFAEVSVALAGFSGIVIAFGRKTSGPLSTLEVRRLTNLFILSGAALIISLLWMSLLHVEFEERELLWRGGSAAVIVLSVPWLVWDLVRVFRLDQHERVEVKTSILVVFNAAAVAMLLLQIANVLAIAQAWPFFLALVLIIAGAFQQFILLVRMGFRRSERIPGEIP